MKFSSSALKPLEWTTDDDGGHKNKRWDGYTELFENYQCVTFNFPPITIKTHDLKGWRMYFRQKNSKSRLYLHFNNKKNFGFRTRLPARQYVSIADMFYYMYDTEWNITSSENSVTNVVQKYVNTTETKIVKVNTTLEEALAVENQRILSEIGDYRGKKVIVPDNVIDFSAYMKEPKPIESSEVIFERLLENLA